MKRDFVAERGLQVGAFPHLLGERRRRDLGQRRPVIL
jgi:hypothetical protein